jgi:hypothetical protein
MEKICWAIHVKNEGVFRTVNEERNILHAVKRRKTKRIVYSLLAKYLLEHVIGGKIEGTGRRIRYKQQLKTLRKREDAGT